MRKTEKSGETEAELEALIKRLADGDIGAIGPIYEMTRRNVYMLALSILKNSAEAEDASHDCYIRIAESAAKYRPNGKPMGWIMTVAKNVSLTRLRELKRQAHLEQEDWNELLSTDETDCDLQIAEMLGALSDDERQTVLLHDISGFKFKEIASILDTPLPTVLSRHARAMKKLKLDNQ